MRQRFGGSFFAVGVDDVGAALALGLGLLGHGALHIARQLDILNLDILDIDAPFVSLGVNNFFNLL